MMIRYVFPLILLLILNVSQALAAEFRRSGQDYRAMAMGNTGIAGANNNAVLFYNPAAMANISTWWADLPMLEISFSDDAKELYDTIQSDGFDLESEEEQLEFMEDYIGKNPYVKVDVGANVFMNVHPRGFTIGGNYTYEAIVDIEVRNPTSPVIETFARLDQIRQFGFSYPLGLGQWVIGATYKYVERQEIEFEYGMAEVLAEEEFPDVQSDGITDDGYGYDIGFLYRTASKYRIIFGGVYRQKIELEGVSDVPEEVALGVSMSHTFDLFRFSMMMDARDLTFQQGEDGDRSLNRRLHYGIELGFAPIDKTSNFISIRGGYNQGYFTYGAEIKLMYALTIGYTRYTEETGEYAGQKPSERTAYYLSLGF